MKCFYSWSGEFSRDIAEQFCNWFRGTLQTVEIFYSPEIEKGTKWLHRLHQELEQTDFGLAFLTKDNYTEPWILYESGAIAKRVTESRLYTILIDCKPSDISGPLSYFQHTLITKSDISKLAFNLNSANKNSQINQNVLSDVIDSIWVLFETPIKRIVDRNSWRQMKYTDRELIESLNIKTNEILGAIHGRYDLSLLDPVVSGLEDKRRIMEYLNIEEDEYSSDLKDILEKIKSFYDHIGMIERFNKLIEKEQKNSFRTDGRFVNPSHD